MKRNVIIILTVICLISCEKDKVGEEIALSNKGMQKYLLTFWDTNKDGILSKEEALEVTDIWIENSQESIIDGLEHFPNLEELHIGSGNYTGIDVSKNYKLKKLSVNLTKIKTLDLTSNQELEVLIFLGRELESISLGAKYKLTELSLSDVDKLSFLDVRGCPNLIQLSCCYSLLTELDVRHNPHLERIVCYKTLVESIDLRNNPKLKSLNCGGNKLLTKLDVSENTELSIFLCGGNSMLTKIDVSNNTELFEFECSGNVLMTTLDVSNNTKLESLFCNGLLGMTTLDVSNNPKLWQLHCQYIGKENSR